MRHAKASLLIALAVLFLSPKPALAQWDIIKWIQELSGPGPFEVIKGIDLNFKCFPEQTGDVAVHYPREFRALFCDREPFRWRSVKRFYGVNLGLGEGKNNLVFPAGIQANENGKVSMAVITFRGAWRPDALVDVGSLAGVHRFSATPGVVVNRFVIDPYVAIRPLGRLGRGEPSNRAKDIWARLVEVTFGVTIYPEGFTAQEFGAIGTTAGSVLSGNAEAIFHYGFKILFTF